VYPVPDDIKKLFNEIGNTWEVWEVLRLNTYKLFSAATKYNILQGSVAYSDPHHFPGSVWMVTDPDLLRYRTTNYFNEENEASLK